MKFISKKLYKLLRKEEKQIDLLMWGAGLIGPLTLLPQVVLVYMNQSAENLSLSSWVAASTVCFIYLLYSSVHKIKPMFVANLLWFSIYASLIVGILMFD